MFTSTGKSARSQCMTIGTAEAFYRVFCALPKHEQLAVACYILEGEEIQRHLEIPNETTLEAFDEDKSKMSVFHTIDELRKDLLT